MKAPRFDLIMLGLGAEGHTASLFPHSAALSEADHWVAAVYVPQNQSWRITLTPVALNAASKVMFVVVGEEKAQAVKQVLSEPKQPDLLPAQIVDPPQGQVLWILDRAAAMLLEP
jgi:6-phosphogluconolactonase